MLPGLFFKLGNASLGRARVQPILAVTGGPPLSGVLSLYPFGIKEGPYGASLAMYPSVGFASQAKRYVNKERRSLAMHLFVGFPKKF